MKAILVIDMPESCTSCLLGMLGIYNKKWFCLKTNKDIDITDRYYMPKWCPLKPMPLKRETHVYWNSVGIGNVPTHEITDYDKGWNDCVEFLEGELND